MTALLSVKDCITLSLNHKLFVITLTFEYSVQRVVYRKAL